MLNRTFILEEWVPALRSGNYIQGRGGLRDSSDSYCCLGVCADLVKDRLHLEWERVNYAEHYELAGNCGSLPEKVLEFVGLDDPQHVGLEGTLIDLNDNVEYSFDEIADYLVKQVNS